MAAYAINTATYGDYFVLAIDDKVYKLGFETCRELKDLLDDGFEHVSGSLTILSGLPGPVSGALAHPRLLDDELIQFEVLGEPEAGIVTLPKKVAYEISQIRGD